MAAVQENGFALVYAAADAFQFCCYYYLSPVLLVMQTTWLINSATHVFGVKEVHDGMSSSCEARNVAWLHLVLPGENWHNNHHGAPSSASTWHRWYQVDVPFLFLRCLEACGLVWNVKEHTAGLEALEDAQGSTKHAIEATKFFAPYAALLLLWVGSGGRRARAHAHACRGVELRPAMEFVRSPLREARDD